jgi:hypothetical protein
MPVRSSVILSCARQRNARGERRDQERSSMTYGPAWGHASALAESGKAIGKVTLSEF